MKINNLIVLTFLVSCNPISDESCANMKACSAWATRNGNTKYDLGGYEKQKLNLVKNFSLNFGTYQSVFNFIIQSNGFVRLEKSDGTHKIELYSNLVLKDFPQTTLEDAPKSLDFYSVKISNLDKNKSQTAKTIIKSFLSPHGRIIEHPNSFDFSVVDDGIHLNAIGLIVKVVNNNNVNIWD